MFSHSSDSYSTFVVELNQFVYLTRIPTTAPQTPKKLEKLDLRQKLASKLSRNDESLQFSSKESKKSGFAKSKLSNSEKVTKLNYEYF